MKPFPRPPDKPIVMSTIQDFADKVHIAKDPAAETLKCIACFKGAHAMYQGSSWCESCLKEKFRTGIGGPYAR